MQEQFSKKNDAPPLLLKKLELMQKVKTITCTNEWC